MDTRMYTALGLPPKPAGELACESGQVVVDRRREWVRAAIWYTWVINCHDVTYRLLFGDKDTYRIGWQLAIADRQYWQQQVQHRVAPAAAAL